MVKRFRWAFAAVACVWTGCTRAKPSVDSAAIATSATPPAAMDRARGGERSATSDADSAVAALRAYYAAINQRNYARAFSAWGSAGPPGHPSMARFAAGFAATDSARILIGTVGRVEGAAGSRYVDIPVTVHAFERGRDVVYSGTYTLRRTVVQGAEPLDQHWHLYKADLGSGRKQP